MGLSADLGAEYGSVTPLDPLSEHFLRNSQTDAVREVGSVGASFGLASGDELTLTLGPTFGPLTSHGREWGFSAAPTYRDFRGRESWKSFIEAGLKMDTAPMFAIGAVFAVGLEYELSPFMGLYARGQISPEVGQILRIGLGATIGIQGRSYLFDVAQ